MKQLFIVTLLSACLSVASTYAADKTFIIGDFTAYKALELRYGNLVPDKEPNSQVAIWKNIRVPAKMRKSFAQPSRGAKVSPVFSSQFTQNGVDKYYIVTSAAPIGDEDDEFTCHICVPLIGVMLFSRSGDGWQLESENKYLGVDGTFGKPPAVQLSKIGQDHYGLQFESDDMHQGYATYHTYLVTYLNKKFRQVLNLWIPVTPTEGSHPEQASKETGIKVVMTPRQGQQFYDVDAVLKWYKGSKHLTYVDEKQHFIFKNEGYHRAK